MSTDTIYVGAATMGETQEGTYVYDEASARRLYDPTRGPVEGTLTCDACMTLLYAIDHDRIVFVAPHISTEMFTGCLPCMVGAVVHGGGYLTDNGAAFEWQANDYPAPPVSEDAATTPPLPVLAQITVTVQALDPAAWPADALI